MKNFTLGQDLPSLGRATRKGKHWLLAIECFCGKRFFVYETNYKRRGIKSCGCVKGELISMGKIHHGMATRKNKRIEWVLWSGMKQRCSPTSRAARYYFDRGIAVCPEWLTSFEAFYQDMGSKPEWATGIDRIDNNKGYEPGNCRWANAQMQSENRRSVILVDGLPLKSWCKKHGIEYKYAHRLYKKAGLETLFAYASKRGYTVSKV